MPPYPDFTSDDAKDRGSPRESKCGGNETTPANQADFQKKANREMRTNIVEVEVERFLNELVRDKKIGYSLQQAVEDQLNALATCSIEADMYPILCRVFEGVSNKSKGWLFRIIGNARDAGSAPDIAMYHDEDLDHWGLHGADLKDHKKQMSAHARYGRMGLMVEAKWKSPPAFGFPTETGKTQAFLPGSGATARAQHFKHAAEIFRAQHRTHLFSIYIVQQAARLIYFDRAGMIVSKVLDLTSREGKERLCEFVYSVTTMERTRLGYDSSVALATEAEVFKLSAPDNKYFEHRKAEMLDQQEHFPIYKVRCANVGAPGTSTYLIGKPCASHYSLFGRGTRGYVAYNLEHRRWVFLKDMWKDASPSVHFELEVYERLQGVSFIPTAIGGNLLDNKTKAQDFFHDFPPAARVHCRLVLKDVGRPLEDYEDGPHLIAVVGDALVAHWKAYDQKGVLHRDISVGNIMIDAKTGTGLLVDWDLSKYREELRNGPSQPGGRSGTWPFLSALSLMYVNKPNEVADDLESFLYVLLWMAGRFHEHIDSNLASDDTPKMSTAALSARNQANGNLADFVSRFFLEEVALQDGRMGGGTDKHRYITSEELPVKLNRSDDGSESPLASLVSELYGLVRQHYRALNLSDLERFRVSRAGSRRHLQGEKTVVQGPRVIAPELAALRLKARLQSAQPSSSPATNTGSTSIAKAAARVLDSHDEFVLAFAKFTDPDIKWRLDASEKTVDQFLGLGRTELALPIRDASSTSSSTHVPVLQPQGNKPRRSSRFSSGD